MKGYIKDYIEEDHYVLGGGFIPQKQVVNESGDWTNYLPKFEPQAEKYETWGCTVWGTQNCIETVLKKVVGKEFNFIERYNYNVSSIEEPGASPHHVIEDIRKEGLIESGLEPLPATFEEFKTPRPVPVSLLEEGQKFLDEWDLKHEWVFIDGEKNKKEKMKEMLKYSPLGVAVYAWKKNGRVYTKEPTDEDNHWTMLYKIDDKGFYHIFDSYGGKKVLSPDYEFERVKVFFLFKRTEPRDRKKSIVANITSRLLNFLQKLLVIEKPKPMKEKLFELAKSKLGTDFTPDWVVSDEVSCAFAVTTILKEIKPEIPIIINTGELYRYMRKNTKLFREIPQPIGYVEKGLIIIAPTGYNTRRDVMPHGHVFISSENEVYMSNTSATGLWEENYTRVTARKRYAEKGGFPIYVFELLG